jgi:hypothetical protein
MAKGDIHRGTLSVEEISEIKTMLASILSKLEDRDREERERHEALLNIIETGHRKTLASFDKVAESPQTDDQEKVSNQELQSDVETADSLGNGQIELASENQIVEFTFPEQTDVILRRLGERVEQIQLQTNEASMLDQDQNSSVECVQVLETEQIESSSESQIVELSNSEQAEVILRRQGEHAEQNLIEKICEENFDLDEVKAKENISECDDVSFVSYTPCKEKENVNGLSMPKPSGKTEIVGVKESRAKCFASYIIVSNRLNDSKGMLLPIKDSFETFHSKQLDEVLQISVPTRNSSNKLEHQCSKRSQSRYRHLHRYNPVYRSNRQNFRGGTYTKKNEGRK